MIAGYHPHTVGDSGVPLYMQGFPPGLSGLGQDDLIDPSMYDPGNVLIPPDFGPSNSPVLLSPSGADLGLQPSIFDPTGPLVAPPNLPTNTQDIANLYASAVATGVISPAQAAAMAAQAIKAAGTIAKTAAGPVFSPSPRVTVPLPGSTASFLPAALTQATIVPGIPNIALIGGGLLLAMAMGGKR
jgi:hypothetical protein